MSETQTLDPADVICGLKAAVTALECHHKMQLMKTQCPEDSRKSPYKTADIRQKDKRKEISKKQDTTGTSDATICRSSQPNKSELKFPEMRGGVLYARCMCLHRDGLQDCCPLSQCQGQPQCRVKPWPVCPPGLSTRRRYPELYPMPSN